MVSLEELDSVEASYVSKAVNRRQRCAERLPKVFFAVYIVSALTITVLCLTVWRSSILSAGSTASVSSFNLLAHSNNAGSDVEHFNTLATCVNANDNICSNGGSQWCCPSSQSCGSTFGTCNANIGLIIGIIIAVWIGPLAIYLLVIAIVRFSQLGRFQSLANSGRYQSWVIVSGCFQMSVDSSSGDAEFNQAAFNLVNVYGGCGDECVMHCIGIWCFGFCYPCCMCCVSAGRNQTKVGTLQSGMAARGYNSNVQFLSSVIPACCNSIFIGLISRQQPGGVMVVTTSVGGQVFAQPMMYAQNLPGGAVQYAQPAAYGQPQYAAQPGVYAQPQFAPQYAQQPAYGQPQYAQVAAAPIPAYSAVPTADMATTGPAAIGAASAVSASAQPPEVVKPQP